MTPLADKRVTENVRHPHRSSPARPHATPRSDYVDAEDTAMDTAVVVDLERTSLRERIRALREGIAALHEQIEDLRKHRGPALEAEYAAAFGDLELALLAARADLASAKRSFELVVAAVQRGAELTVDLLASIDAQVAEEHRAWRDDLARQADTLARQKAWLGGDPVTDDRVAEARTLYRALVRALHPDLVGAESEDYLRHWQTIQDAHAAFDVAVLAALHALLVEGRAAIGNTPPADDLAALRASAEKLGATLSRLSVRLTQLRGKFPFKHEDDLANPPWIEARRAALCEELAAVRERLAVTTLRLAQVRAGQDPFEVN